MRVESWPIDDIKPYENNPRKNEDAVEYVANSIKEFGFQQPIVLDKDGVIVVGHTRYSAAKELGLTEVPVVIADDLTEDKAKAYRLADNKTGELAIWDWPKLNTELEDIDWLDMNMEDFGFKLYENTIDWDSVEELSDDTYEEPEHVMLKCPKCDHVDRKEHFMRQ